MHARADCSPASAWHAKSNTNPTGVISPFTFSPVIPRSGESGHIQKGSEEKRGDCLGIRFAAASPFGSPLNEQATISVSRMEFGLDLSHTNATNTRVRAREGKGVYPRLSWGEWSLLDGRMRLATRSRRTSTGASSKSGCGHADRHGFFSSQSF